jgi:predicted Zn-dependent protease with MMP-like domain
MTSGTDFHMDEATGSQTFEEIVNWAYSTLPQEIRDLPDFPGIQVVDEPPEDVLKRIRDKRNWPVGTEMLGLYSGVHRTEPQHFLQRIAPDLIFVFRGPILRCSKGDLRAEVKRVVWHEVAHWLGHNEEEVTELGLSLGIPDAADAWATSERPITASELSFDEESGQEAADKPRCSKCYSADVTGRDIDKPLKPSGTCLSDPMVVHAKICKCRSCGYEWDDEDNA